MIDLFKLILGVLTSLFRSRAQLEAEILVLRQQINVLRRRASKRPHLKNIDCFLFVWLCRWFPSVLSAIAIVRPETMDASSNSSARRRVPGGLRLRRRVGIGHEHTHIV
jgi:hypothetical protein